MNTKKIICLLLALTMIFGLAACGGSTASTAAPTAAGEKTEEPAPADKPVTLVIGNVANGAKHPYTMILNWAGEYLSEHGSTISLDIQTGGVLGSETEQCQQVILGTQDMAQTADMSTTNFVPKMAFANFPMLMAGYDDVYEAWGQDGWCFKLASEILAEQDLILIGASDNGFRIITNSKHPVTCVADMKGLKIRVPEVSLLLDIWKEFGAQATPIAFGELTTALQQGTVDGQELGLSSFYDNRWDEFNQYLTQTNYDYSASLIYISKGKYDSLSAQQQQDLSDAFAYACKKGLDYTAEYTQNGLKVMLADGKLQETPMTDEFRDEIYAVGYKIAHTDKWMSLLGEDTVNTMYPSEKRS